MSATRTQVHLSEDQRLRTDRLKSIEGTTTAEVVRRALDACPERVDPDPGPSLSATLGAVPDASAPDRDEWARG